MQRTFLEHLDQVVRETAPPGPTGNLIHKATILRLRDIVDLPNKQKKIQRGR